MNKLATPGISLKAVLDTITYTGVDYVGQNIDCTYGNFAINIWDDTDFTNSNVMGYTKRMLIFNLQMLKEIIAGATLKE